ncbi:hypothetical protein PVAP13_1NG357200 [Panicum virgatum]|uniref:Uncharacterized protein n=1 Tax=Panicum virgatum TaxID=38727 RepID=A0A8T0WTH9_PANVG|nr:hypothetical protein PVAP13_1NG357200 [Panicum virgatum]
MENQTGPHLRLRAASPYPPLTPRDTPGESPHRRRRRPSPHHLRSRRSLPLPREARAAVLQSRPSPSHPRASRLSPTSPCASSSAAAPLAWGGARAAVRHGRGPAGHARRRGPGLPRARGCTSDVARRDAPENRRCPPRTRLCLGDPSSCMDKDKEQYLAAPTVQAFLLKKNMFTWINSCHCQIVTEPLLLSYDVASQKKRKENSDYSLFVFYSS